MIEFLDGSQDDIVMLLYTLYYSTLLLWLQFSSFFACFSTFSKIQMTNIKRDNRIAMRDRDQGVSLV